jgi:hypothetical protein
MSINRTENVAPRTPARAPATPATPRPAAQQPAVKDEMVHHHKGHRPNATGRTRRAEAPPQPVAPNMQEAHHTKKHKPNAKVASADQPAQIDNAVARAGEAQVQEAHHKPNHKPNQPRTSRTSIT